MDYYTNLPHSGRKRKATDHFHNTLSNPPIKVAKFGLKTIAKVNVNVKATHERPFFHSGCLHDCHTIKMARDINTCPEGEIPHNFINSENLRSLQQLKKTITSALDRITEHKPAVTSSNSEITDIPDSPVSMENFPILVVEKDVISRSKNQGFKVSDQHVTQGTGVIATHDYKQGDFIANYDGDIACRIFCNKFKNTFYAFTVKENNKNFELKFLERDTFVAWSGVTFQKTQGCNSIELGRNGTTEMKYLNHSKNANVKVLYHGKKKMRWQDHEKLSLCVTAIRDIHTGEELLFDYAPEIPDNEIDFSISLVEQPSEKKQKNIHKQIQSLTQQSTKSQRPSERVVNLPKWLDQPISDIIEITCTIRAKFGHPASIDDLHRELSLFQKQILHSLFSNNETGLHSFKKSLDNPNKTEHEYPQDNELTTEQFTDLKSFLTKSIFNNKNTWINAKDLKTLLVAPDHDQRT